MYILFRVDSSIQIGAGHVMRCLTLAKELRNRNADVLFVCRDLPGNISSNVKKEGFDISLLSALNETPEPEQLVTHWEIDASETINSIGSRNLDWCVVDHYGIDHRWHQELRPLTHNIMVIDDLANRNYDCDLLLDQTYGRDKSAYQTLVPTDCRVLLGSKFALLRREFVRFRPEALKKRKCQIDIKHILVSMGGMDPNNVVGEVLNALAVVKWKEKPLINVVLGNQAPNLNAVVEQAKSHPLKINVLTNVKNMAELMVDADLAIGAGGTTSWERCCLGLPTVVIDLAKNQKNILNNLKEAGAHIFPAYSNDQIGIQSFAETIEMVLSDNVLVHHMINRSFDVCDGRGAHRVGLGMVHCCLDNGQYIWLEDVAMSDAETIYEWQCHPDTRMYANNPEVPTWQQHFDWMKNKIACQSSYFWMIHHKEEAAGVLRLDLSDFDNGDGYLISILVSPEKYRLGIAGFALKELKILFPETVLYAKVLEDNMASVSLFKQAGFKYRKDIAHYEWRGLNSNNWNNIGIVN